MRDALLLALVAVPIQLAHHLVRGRTGILLLAALSLLLLAGLVLKMALARRNLN
jgi:hypothetical protein